MTDDRPRARTRSLLDLTAALLASHDLSGYTPRQIAEAVVMACYPPRPVARPRARREEIGDPWMTLED